MSPTKLGTYMGPCPKPASAHPLPRRGAQCLGLGQSQCHQATLLLVRVVVGWVLTSKPCPDGCTGAPGAPGS